MLGIDWQVEIERNPAFGSWNVYVFRRVGETVELASPHPPHAVWEVEPVAEDVVA